MTHGFPAVAVLLALVLAASAFAQDHRATPAATPATQPAATPTAAGFLYKTLQYEGETYAYSVYVPPDYTPDRAWPVILFLHGSGERGVDGLLPTEVGIGTAIRREYQRVPAIVVFPQCRPNSTWVGKMGNMALLCLERTSRDYNLDPHRVYLTGLSLGGQGALFLAANMPNRFAAILVVCGFVELGQHTGIATDLAERLKGTPIWCFHGESDTSVIAAHMRGVVDDFRRNGCTVRYTEYPNQGHAIWDRVYADRDMWAWFFAQELGKPEATMQAAPAQP